MTTRRLMSDRLDGLCQKIANLAAGIQDESARDGDLTDETLVASLQELLDQHGPAEFTPDLSDLSGGDWDLLRVRFEFLLGSPDPAAPRPGLDLFKVHYGF